MRHFIEKDRWACNEKTVLEVSGGKEFTLTQPKSLFNEDTYSVKRSIAVEIVPADVVPERDFYVYEIAYMPDGYSLCIGLVDEEAAMELIRDNLQLFLHGMANECIIDFFKGGKCCETK